MTTRASIPCPSCHGPLVPVELRCEACEISVVGKFVGNEFSRLGDDDLHFLRIFVRCEGRIRDMESAMGVSYPTIKARMAQLKQALAVVPAAKVEAAGEKVPEKNRDTTAEVLKELHAGRMSYDDALKLLKKQENP
jgi:hypothetical protein